MPQTLWHRGCTAPESLTTERMRLPFRQHHPTLRANHISLRVWRFVASGPQWIYSYAGAIDQVVLGTVMQTIRRLIEAVPGEWIIDVMIIGVERPLLRVMHDQLQALRGHGAQPCLRRLPGRRAWVRLPSAHLAPPSLLH